MFQLPVASYYKDIQEDKTTYEVSNEVTWIRQNIPELMSWNNAQVQELGDDDFGATQQGMFFQVPVDSQALLDYATFMLVFELTPEHIYEGDCQDKIRGIFEAYKNYQPMQPWENLAKERKEEVIL
jgi:hypothetical protein